MNSQVSILRLTSVVSKKYKDSAAGAGPQLQNV